MRSVILRHALTLVSCVALCWTGAARASEPAAPAERSAESSAETSADRSAAPPTYTVDCPAGTTAAEACKVDKNTYFGWRTFAVDCQVCHGGSALGSTFAPNLLDRLNTRVDYPRFLEVLANGYTGQVGAMPSWKNNAGVMQHADDLYRYLRARADGKLPVGRPQKAEP